MLIFNYGFDYFWDTFPQKVTFDGPNKLILINEGETEIDVQTDIYSGWKEWVEDPYHTNAEFLQALTAIGGEPTVASQKLGITYFLENDWKIRTWEGDHRLIITGNLFSRDGSNPMVPTIGDHNITVQFQLSNLVAIVEGALSALQDSQLSEVWQLHGLDADNPLVVGSDSRTSGDIDQSITGADPVTVQRN